MIKFTKRRLLTILSLVLILVSGFFWFLNKFYSTKTGEWSKMAASNFDDSAIFTSGWEGDYFWVSLDFPGKQNVCVDIYKKNSPTGESNFEIPINQAQRAYFYPEAGTLSDLFSQMTPVQVEERIRQGKPYLLGHLIDNISRGGKDLFFLGENEKFLIPTRNIFNKHFPAKKIPEPTGSVSSLPYANIIINLPEGILLSDGKGVFVISQGKLFLIRSPEVFESLGYRWENIRQMDNYENSSTSYMSGNLINFDSAHANGTILKDNENLFMVWNEKLYKLTSAEQLEYFPEQPVVEISKKNSRANCSTNNDKSKTTCCVSNIDTRLNPPSYSPFLNTIEWDMERIAKKDDINKIDWQSKVAINKENTLKRLISLKNYIVYTLGIVK